MITHSTKGFLSLGRLGRFLSVRLENGSIAVYFRSAEAACLTFYASFSRNPALESFQIRSEGLMHS